MIGLIALTSQSHATALKLISLMMERKMILRLWNHETKTAIVTQNLALELKYDTVSGGEKKN